MKYRVLFSLQFFSRPHEQEWLDVQFDGRPEEFISVLTAVLGKRMQCNPEIVKILSWSAFPGDTAPQLTPEAVLRDIAALKG